MSRFILVFSAVSIEDKYYILTGNTVVCPRFSDCGLEAGVQDLHGFFSVVEVYQNRNLYFAC